jgi:VWFA-related protein
MKKDYTGTLPDGNKSSHGFPLSDVETLPRNGNQVGNISFNIRVMVRWHKGAICTLGLMLSNPVFTSAQEAQKPSPSDTTIRVSTNRVSVGVTVEGTHRHFIKDLRRDDFRIYDNGVEQELTNFLPIEEPAQVVLLVESGPAALFLRPSLLQAAETFLGGISSTDRVAIVSYSVSPMLELDFTTDKMEAGKSLMSLNFMLGFAQQNLLSSVSTTLDWLGSLPGKKTIVILSTGVDDSTSNDWQLIRPKLNASDVHILAVSTAAPLRKPAKRKKLSPDERAERKHLKEGFVAADQLLRQITGATGGHAYFPKNAKEFTDAYAEIAEFVRNEYLLEFAPASEDGQLRSLKVNVRASWSRLNYRQAYLAPAPASPAASR